VIPGIFRSNALQATNGIVGGSNGAAAILGLKRTTLQARIQKLGIVPLRSAVASGRC
jgi:formate hydrogenlyase transcriptional activator